LSIEKTQIDSKENPMKIIGISKVVLNMGVGRSGEIIERAKSLLKDLTNRAPSTRNTKRSVKDFGIHKGEPIGVTVTLREPDASEVLKRVLATKDYKINKSSFDNTGNCSFGIKEHIEIPRVKYDPAIGIFGMDVSVILERPGYRVKRRRRAKSKIGKNHKVNPHDAMEYFRTNLNVEVN
jgi:large subunit ribosomal protein L5